MKTARRPVSLALILSLIASLAPLEAAAQLRGATAGATRAVPVAGLPGGVAPSGPSALSLNLTPSLAGTLSAPALAPAPGLSATPAALAPAAAPAALPALLAASPVFHAAANDAPASPGGARKDEAAPRAAASSAAQPAAAPVDNERHTALGTLKSLLSRAAAPKAGVLPGSADAGRAFDGSTAKGGSAEGTVAYEQGRAARWFLKRFQKSVERRQQDSDAFGGPKPLGPTSTVQKVGYGAKWGLNMAGVAALLNLLVAPLIAAVPWPAFLSDGLLEGFGRVALLVNVGPSEIVHALSLAPGTFLGLPLLAAAAVILAAKPAARALAARGPLSRSPRAAKALVYGGAALFTLFAFSSAPGAFLGFSLPIMAGLEEVSYRVLSFLPTFALLALTRPVLNWLADHLDAVPNHAGVRGGVQAVLRLFGGTLAWYAYPIAATLAAMGFASAHFAEWGVDPFVFVVQFMMGMILTRVAYRSESLSAPITAHLTYNLLTLGGLALAALGFTGLALTYSALVSVLGGVALLYNYLSYRRDRAASKKGLFPGAKMLGIFALATLLGAGSLSTGLKDQSLVRGMPERPAVTLTQGQAPERALAPADATQAGTPAPAAAAPAAESRADVIARVSPSVFKVVVGDGLGTGFILTPQGLAASNAHVVGATPAGGFVMVHSDGLPPVRAQVLAVNHDRDIALLQLPRHPSGAWRPVALAQNAPRVGDETLAIGFPLGLDKTVTRGIVSGLGRHHSQYVAHVQTDASINPGNSGGPLFNERGEVIGMNTYIVTRTGTSIGLGFAIIAPDLARTVAQYAATQDISSGRLGVIANLSDPLKPEAGLQIEYVRPGSGAQAAGLQRGDLIIRVNDALLVEEGGEGAARGIAAVLARSVPGQKVSVTVLRGEQTMTVDVTIDAKPSFPGR